MVATSAKQMQSNGYRLNVGENTKYLLFESEDFSKKMYFLERVSFDLINFCKMNEDKQDEIYARMLELENFLKNFPTIRIKVGDDNVDKDNLDDDVDAFEIEFPTIEKYFRTIYLGRNYDFDLFYNSLKSEEVKDKYRDLYTAFGDLMFIGDWTAYW